MDNEWYWLREIANLLEQLLLKVGTPGPLDWLSGLVLPLLIGTSTLFVAIWAIRIARQSNELAVRLHEQAETSTARRLRIPFSTELGILIGEITFARSQGKDGTEVLLNLDRLDMLRRNQEASDEATAGELVKWALLLARLAPIEEGKHFELSRRLQGMIASWREDPAAAVEAIRADDAELQGLVEAAKVKTPAPSQQAKAAPSPAPPASES